MKQTTFLVNKGCVPKDRYILCTRIQFYSVCPEYKHVRLVCCGSFLGFKSGMETNFRIRTISWIRDLCFRQKISHNQSDNSPLHRVQTSVHTVYTRLHAHDRAQFPAREIEDFHVNAISLTDSFICSRKIQYGRSFESKLEPASDHLIDLVRSGYLVPDF